MSQPAVAPSFQGQGVYHTELPIPAERFLFLLKKNMSRSRTNRLSPSEIEELKLVKSVLTKEQWGAYVEQARIERRSRHCVGCGCVTVFR